MSAMFVVRRDILLETVLMRELKEREREIMMLSAIDATKSVILQETAPVITFLFR